MIYQYNVKFPGDSVFTDISHLVRYESVDVSIKLFNSGLKSVVDTYSFSLKYDRTIFDSFYAANSKILCEIKDGFGTFIFAGYISPEMSNDLGEVVDSLNVTVLDNSFLLDEEIITTFEYPAVVGGIPFNILDISNPSSSIVHQLLSASGYTVPDIFDPACPNILYPIEHIAGQSGNGTYRQILDTLLMEHGYILSFTTSGQFTVIPWIIDTLTPDYLLGGDFTIKEKLKIKKAFWPYDGLKLFWNSLTIKDDMLLYRDDLPISMQADQLLLTGEPIAAGDYYPADGDIIDTWQEFKTDWLDLAYLKRETRLENEDISLISSSNHICSFNADTGVNKTVEVFEPKRARILFLNSSGVTLKIYEFEIRGTALYRNAINKIVVPETAKKMDEYQSRYIFNNTTALRLAYGMQQIRAYGSMEYSFTVPKDHQEYSPGDLVHIIQTDPNLDTNVLIREKRFSDKTDLISYTCIAVVAYATTSAGQSSVIQTTPAGTTADTNQGIVSGLPTFSDIDNGYDSTIGTSVPTAPVLNCESAYKSIILKLDKQTNLRWLKDYEFQVSSDGSTWYSLKFDGTDWKDALEATTAWPTEQLVHSRIPSDLTNPDDPQPRTLFYRVCCVTVQNVASDWSATVTGITSLIETGDIPANTITANMITTTFLQAAFMNISGSVSIGFQGTGTVNNPNSGDRRVYIDGDEIGFEEYTNGTWSTVNSIKLGGADSNGNFAPFLSCRGVVNPLASAPNVEFFPSEEFRVFNFENNVEDQQSVDDWNLKQNVGYSASIRKFGGYGWLSTTGVSILRASENWTVGASQTAGAWVYFYELGTSPRHTILGYFTDGYDEIDIFIDNDFSINLRLTIDIQPIVILTSSIIVTTGQWYYIGLNYDSEKNIASLIVNNDITSQTVSNAWGTPANPIIYAQVQKSDGATTCYSIIDELLFAPDVNVNPDLFIQHYNHNVPWNTDASAKDLIMKPAAGGRLLVDGGFQLKGEPDFDTDWHVVGATGEPAFQNSWVNYGTYTPARFRKGSDGFVQVEGMVKSGTGLNTIFTLPIGYRPDYRILGDAIADSALARVDINTDGTVLLGIGSTAWLSFMLSYYVSGGYPVTGAKGDQGVQGDIGLPGIDGNTILNGVGVPTAEGVDGDFYINTQTYDIHGPKATTWPSGVSLVGPAGNLANVAVGTIWMFDANNPGGASGGVSGAWTDNGTMAGWYACVAANAIYGCPDLVDKFVMGKVVAGAGVSGGSNTHTITSAELPAHTHTMNHDHGSVNSGYISSNHTHTYTTNTGTGAGYSRQGGGGPYWYSGRTGNVSSNHYHAVNLPNFTGNSGNGGFANNAIDNRPAYYSLIFIRKCF